MRESFQHGVEWFEDRTGLVSAVREFLDEEIPASSGWAQVFGSVALFLFLIQVFTGILLALNYAPQPGSAYYSLQYIINVVTGGKLVRGLHHWGASVMVIVVVLHMVQVIIWGAYKKPREANWLAGVGLLLLVLGFGLTGYLLPWDNRAYWSTVVTIQIAGLAPGAGEFVMRLLGSEDGAVGVGTFSRFYTLHVMVLPAITALLVAFHIYLVRRHGVTPQPGDESRPKKRFYPEQLFKDVTAVFVTFVILFLLAALVEVPLERIADPTDSTYIPRPEWYFLFLFQMLKFFEGSLEVVGAIVLPTIGILLLAALPFLDRSKLERVTKRVPAMAAVAVAFAAWAGLTTAAVMTTPEQTTVAGTVEGNGSWMNFTPTELAGLAYFRQENCATCHNLLEGEPKIGPTLATVSQRKSADWMIAHFKNPAAVVPGSPMPPVRLPDEELNSLAAFLLRLNPDNAVALDQTPDFALRGAQIYVQYQCRNCHIVNGGGNAVGPPLNGVGLRRDREWIVGHFRDPQAFSPGSTMPPYDLPPEEMDPLVEYVMALPPG